MVCMVHSFVLTLTDLFTFYKEDFDGRVSAETGHRVGFKVTMKMLPDSVRAYKKTPIFDETTVPSGLLKDHNTKASVWGKIVVLSGILEYRIEGPQAQVYVLTDTNPGVVEPMVVHSIKPQGQTRFYVEFYK